jgi:hypothetical protein
LEEGRVHAEFQWERPAEPASQLTDQVPHKGHGAPTVMHVARPVAQPQDLARLGQMGQQRVVTGIFAMVGIEAAEGPRHRPPGSHNRAIDVNGQPAQPQPLDLLIEQGAIERDQRLQRLLGKLLEPVDDGAIGRNPRQATQAPHERIVSDIPQMLQPASPDGQESDDQQDQAPTPVVPGESVRAEDLTDAAVQIQQGKVAAQEFQSAVRGEFLADKFHTEITFDSAA